MALIHLTPFADRTEGTESWDTIFTYDGRDTIWGRGGHDKIYGGSQIDEFYGGEGNDRLDGKAGDDILKGEGGHDTLIGGAGNDRMEGGFGDDSYVIEDAGDIVVERQLQGTDTLTVHMDRAGFSSYTIPDYFENLRIFSANNHPIYRITGNNFRNDIRVNYGSNTRMGIVYGEDGSDTISGSNNRNVVERIYGGNDNDTLRGNNGKDYLYGERHDDTLRGGGGDDTLHGGRNDDELIGGAGNDYLKGYDSSNNSNSRLDRDILTGGRGRDKFDLAQNSAGASVNRNPYAQGRGYAVITDFNRNEDRIRLTWRGNMDGFSLGVQDFNNDGRDDTIVYYGSRNSDNIVGVIENNTGLSLNSSYFY